MIDSSNGTRSSINAKARSVTSWQVP